jgi:hypothetical protein
VGEEVEKERQQLESVNMTLAGHGWMITSLRRRRQYTQPWHPSLLLGEEVEEE